jgi:hypothetical protein
MGFGFDSLVFADGGRPDSLDGIRPEADNILQFASFGLA